MWPTFQECKIMLHLTEGAVSIQIIWNFSTWVICLSSPFYLCINCLFTSVRNMHNYFILWIIIHCYFIYFVFQIALSLAIRRFFHWNLCPFYIPSPSYVYVLVHTNFFLTTQDSRLILHVSSFTLDNKACLPEKCFPFYLRTVLEIL